MVTDAPVQLYALLYIPGKAERGVFALRKDDGLKLYSRNILIDEYNKDLLPEYLRFVQVSWIRKICRSMYRARRFNRTG